MADPQEANIPPANTPAEINIHLGYLRRDILDMKDKTQKDLQEIKTQISDLDDHYVSEGQFLPVAKAQEKLIEDVRILTEWKDTLNGKMVGFGVAISVITALLELALTHYLK